MNYIAGRCKELYAIMRQLKILKQITNREAHSLDKYLQEIARLDLIDSNQEVELARRVRQGDDIALEKLTKANLRFVVSVAKQYQNFGLSLGDLINEGNVGLIKAARRFDETRGFKFISYAVWWIRQCIMQSLAENARVVRLPLNQVAALNKMLRVFSQLEQTYQRQPSAGEVADEMCTTAANVTDMRSRSGRQVSIDAPVTEGEDTSLLDTLEDHGHQPDALLFTESLKTEIERALGSLPVREAEIMSLLYGLNGRAPMSLVELGVQFGLTCERVRQIKEQAIRKLRHRQNTPILRTYL